MKQVAAVVALVLALATAACGADEPADGAGGEASSTASATPSPSQSVVLPDPEPTVDPATGPVLDIKGVTLRLPEKWRVGYDTDLGGTAAGPQGTLAFAVIAGDQMPLAALMRRDVRSTGPVEDLREQPVASLGGVSAYHYIARTSSVDVRHAFGTWDEGYRIWIHFNLRSRIPEEEREQLAQSVIATYETPS